MDFKEWWNKEYWDMGPSPSECAEEAWDYQQTIIDELQYLNGLQENHIAQLQAKLRAKYGGNSAE